MLWDREWQSQNFFRSALRISMWGRGGKEARGGGGQMWDEMGSLLRSEQNAMKNCEGGAELQTPPALLGASQVFPFSNQPPSDTGRPWESGEALKSSSFNHGHLQDRMTAEGRQQLGTSSSVLDRNVDRSPHIHYWWWLFSPSPEAPISPLKVGIPQHRRKWKFAQPKTGDISNSRLEYIFLRLPIGIQSLA